MSVRLRRKGGGARCRMNSWLHRSPAGSLSAAAPATRGAVPPSSPGGSFPMNSPGNAGFGPVLAVRSLLSALTVPYWIAGGWAIDLAVGRVTRDHADVDIMLLERDEHALRTDFDAGRCPAHRPRRAIWSVAGRPAASRWPRARSAAAHRRGSPRPAQQEPPAARRGAPGQRSRSLLGLLPGAHAASAGHSPASPATGMASRSWLPRWCCCSSLARRARRISVTSRLPCRSSTPNSAHGSTTPWNTCHAGRQHRCPAGEISRRHAATRRPAPLGICARVDEVYAV